MLRKFDAFARPIDGLSKTSTVGGIITITAYVAAIVLLLFQLGMYWNVETTQYLQMAKSQTSSHPAVLPTSKMNHYDYQHHIPSSQAKRSAWEVSTRTKIPLSFHVTFPHIPCSQLEVSHDDARGEQFRSIHGQGSFQKYTPNADEIQRMGVMLGDTTTTVSPNTNQVGNNPSLASKLLGSKLVNQMVDKVRSLNSCTIRGKIVVPKVGGMLSIGLTPEAWQQVVVFVNTGISLDGSAPQVMNVRYVTIYYY